MFALENECLPEMVMTRLVINLFMKLASLDSADIELSIHVNIPSDPFSHSRSLTLYSRLT